MSGIFHHGGHHHGGHMAGGPGHHGISLGQILGLGGHHSFLGHLLGHHSHHGHAGHHTGHGATWLSTIRGEKGLRRILGVDISPVFTVGGLILIMAVWLGLISWLRHQDGKANQIVKDVSQAAPGLVTPHNAALASEAASARLYSAQTLAAFSPGYQTPVAPQAGIPAQFGAPSYSGAQPYSPAGANRPSMGTYGVCIQTASGPRLRITTNR